MNCLSCGREFPGGAEARFCPMCGSPRPTTQSADNPSPAHPPLKGKRLRRIMHTFEWHGVCPVCKLVHTAENTPCPICGAALAVGFPATWRWSLFQYPFESAEMCCSAACGFNSNAIPCYRECATITSTNLSFAMPELVSLVHALISMAFLIPALVTFFRAFVIWWMNNDHLHGNNIHARDFLTQIMIGSFCLFLFVANAMASGLPFQRWFNFSAVS